MKTRTLNLRTIISWIPALPVWGILFTLTPTESTLAQTLASQSDPIVITSITPENGKLRIRWEGSVPPYKLQMRTSFADTWRDVTFHIYANDYLTEEVSGQAYWRVRTIPDTTAPALPTSLAGATEDCDQVTLTWDPLPCPDTRWCGDNTGGTGLRGYRIYRNGTFLREVATTSLVDTGLVGSTSYSYQIAAIDWAGNESAQTAEINATTPACVVVAGDETVTLAWDPNPEPDVDGYILYVGEETGVYTDSLDIGNFTTGTVPGLTAGNTYYFVVTAYNAYGESDPSNEVGYTVP